MAAVLLTGFKAALDTIFFPLSPVFVYLYSMSPFPSGQTVSHYKILEKLGKGGMAWVYLAEDLKQGRKVAIKFLDEEHAADPESRRRFVHEARAQAMLSHANIATFYEADEEKNTAFIVMEYIEGQKLAELAKSEKLSLSEILELVIQVGEGLSAAHEKGVMHRDINPTNILVTPKRVAKITDFGLAKWKGASTITRTGLQMGTDHYMSPEQVDERKADHRTDIFSLGVVLYELICARRPFEGNSRKSLFYEILYVQPQPLPRYSRDTTESLERIVFKCLAKKPEERYQSAADLVADLKKERKSLESREPFRFERKKKWKKLLPFLVPAAAILFVLLWYFIPPPEAKPLSLAVMYFENLTDPEDKDHTGDMLTNLLTTSLSQLNGIEVVSRERLFDLQQEMGKPNEKRLTPALATRIAKRAGVKTMLLGNILGSQPRLAVTSRLIDVQSGKIISSRRLTGFPGDSLFPFVDSLAILVTNDLKLPPAAVSNIKPLAEVTTASQEAYRAYMEGTELYGKHLYSDAVAALDQAIELDSNFAMAYWRKFVLVRFFAPADTTPSYKYLQKALELKKRVTERERLNLESAYALQVEEDCRKTAELCERAIQKFPKQRDEDTYWRLYLCYSLLGEQDKARQFIMKGLEKDSLDVFFVNLLADHYTVLGRKKEALQYIDRTIRFDPTNFELYAEKANIYFFDGEIDSTVFWWQKALSFRPDFRCAEQVGFVSLLRRNYPAAEEYFRRFTSSPRPSPKAKGEAQLTLIPLHQGKFGEVKTRLLKLQASATIPILLTSLQSRQDAVYHLLTLLALETGDRSQALRYAREIYRKAKERNPRGHWARDLLAIVHLRNGNLEMAYKLLGELRRDLDKPGRAQYQRAIPDFTAGFLAYEEEKYPEAVKNFEKGFVRPRMKAPLFQYGVSLLKTGRIDEGIKELQRVTWWVPLGVDSDIDLTFLPTWTFWPVYAVKAHYWLGVAYEQKGDKVKALQEYEKFLDIWKAADPGIAEVEDARERLARLKKKG